MEPDFYPQQPEQPTPWDIQEELLSRANVLRLRIDAARPFSPDLEAKVVQQLRFKWDYHSNAIEGNALTYGETVALLKHGLTAKGKPLKDHLDIRGHNEAVLFLLEIVKEARPITEVDMRALHKMMLVEDYQSRFITENGVETTRTIRVGQYKTTPNHVLTQTGEIHYYADPLEVPRLMSELAQYIAVHLDVAVDENKRPAFHPVWIAANVHHKLTQIHPFDDGNGRMARWVMNLILLRYGYFMTVITHERRNEYYAALAEADAGNTSAFVAFVAECVIETLEEVAGALGVEV